HMGLYTDMNAIRRDEKCDELHSVYVDQWDWEKVISKDDRNETYLKGTVKAIYGAILYTIERVERRYPQIHHDLPEDITFITTQQLEDEYPDLTPKQREDAAAKKYKAVFLMKIGGKLKSGIKHDGRAPDYDDWELNGDIILYSPVLDRAFEISSMGIRVDENSLVSQLRAENAENRLEYEFHKLLVNKILPYSIGGGIGQSRLCMYILQKMHIGEVQSSVWPQSELDRCEKIGIELL
ncbi:MAG: aspartate--ammonia ligase, partial [Acutalibacteraceae bacterium]